MTDTYGRLTWHSAAATFEMLPGSVLLVKATGPVSSQAMWTFSAPSEPELRGLVRARLLDYSGAIILATGDELAALANGPAFDTARRPAAFVAPLGTFDLLRWQSVRMAARGFDRRAFIDAGSAYEWLLHILDSRETA